MELPFDTEASRISGLSNGEKNELLFSHGINYNDLPSWQKRGIGAYFAEVEKNGYNPKTKEVTIVKRRELLIADELPIGNEYDTLLMSLLSRE